MKIAIIHNDGRVLVSFDEPRFRELIKQYGGDDRVLDKIIKDLKKELLKI